jgi:hypothetical protein
MTTEGVRGILAANPKLRHLHGALDIDELDKGNIKQKKELVLRGLGGWWTRLRGSRRPDATLAPEDESHYVHFQLPRIDGKGRPTKRELQAAFEIARRDGHSVVIGNRRDLARLVRERYGKAVANIPTAKIDLE